MTDSDRCFCSQHDLAKYPGGIFREPFIHRRDVCGAVQAIASRKDVHALRWYREVLMMKLHPSVREGQALVGRTWSQDFLESRVEIVSETSDGMPIPASLRMTLPDEQENA